MTNLNDFFLLLQLEIIPLSNNVYIQRKQHQGPQEHDKIKHKKEKNYISSLESWVNRHHDSQNTYIIIFLFITVFLN